MRRRLPVRSEPREVERRLLGLATELTALGRTGRAPLEVLSEALGRLSAGLAEPATSSRSREKARRLAVAWAREQVRVALAELLERATAAGAARRDVATGTLAWLVVAGCEALSREAPDAVPDRLSALAAFIRPGESSA